eukprot:TRINITY_DN60844_c0_g1_i1.p1 TRINITY_DN60844_c0_g1~~TRINITY_DN60844_c0_g1_i1.p1  ORF type:complete len:594 (+),score=93.46 TRINITY_DN60844_c0_g1_i1:63-1844(+)
MPDSLTGKDADERSSSPYLARTGSELLSELRARFHASVLYEVVPDPMQEWSPIRRALGTMVQSIASEALMTFLVLYNLLIMILETDATAVCPEQDGTCIPEICVISNPVLLGIYTVDLLLRAFVERRLFVFSGFNWLDIIIVVLAYVEIIVAAVSGEDSASWLAYLRMLKLARILRVVRLFRVFPQLYSLVAGFISTALAIFWGGVMIFFLLTMWSLITVEIVAPLRSNIPFPPENRDWCEAAFSSVINGILFYFQTLIAGDSWGACSIPISRAHPPLVLVFTGALLMIQLGFTNLILAVIVDNSAASREEDQRKLLKMERTKEDAEMMNMYKVLHEFDADASNTISFDELNTAFSSDLGMKKKLVSLGITSVELEELFTLMDPERRGECSYFDIMDTIRKIEKQDPRSQGIMAGLHFKRITRMLQDLKAHQDSIDSRLDSLLRGLSKDTFGSFSSQENTSTIDALLEVDKIPPEVDKQLEEVVAKLSGEEIYTVTATTQTALAQCVHDVEEELRSLGVDLEGRLEALAHEAEERVRFLEVRKQAFLESLVTKDTGLTAKFVGGMLSREKDKEPGGSKQEDAQDKTDEMQQRT